MHDRDQIETRVHNGIRTYAVAHHAHANFRQRIAFGRYVCECAHDETERETARGTHYDPAYAGEYIGPSLAWLSGQRPNTGDHFELSPQSWAQHLEHDVSPVR